MALRSMGATGPGGASARPTWDDSRMRAVTWASHAFWYTLIALFVASLGAALVALVVSILASTVTIVRYSPALFRQWRRRR